MRPLARSRHSSRAPERSAGGSWAMSSGGRSKSKSATSMAEGRHRASAVTSHRNNTSGRIASASTAPRMPATKSQSPRDPCGPGNDVRLEQRHVLGVRLPEDVGDVAEKRHETDREVDRHIQEHAQQHDARHPDPVRLTMMAQPMSAVTRSPAHGTRPMIESHPKRSLRSRNRNASSSKRRSALSRSRSIVPVTRFPNYPTTQSLNCPITFRSPSGPGRRPP